MTTTGPFHSLTDDDQARLRELLTDGSTVAAAARALGCHHRPHRSVGRQPPATRYLNQPRATLLGDQPSRHDRIRVDKVNSGKITLRYEGQLRKLYIGRRHNGLAVLAVCLGPEVTVVEKDTGTILAYFRIDPTKAYQRIISGPPTGTGGRP